MTYGGGASAAGAGAAAAAAAIAQAIRASGVLVRIEPDSFNRIVARSAEPLIVTARPRFLSRRSIYLTSYKGLAFYALSKVPLQFPPAAEVIEVRRIWVPSLSLIPKAGPGSRKIMPEQNDRSGVNQRG